MPKKDEKKDYSYKLTDLVPEFSDEAQEKGVWGSEVDKTPNEEYTLKTGPDSPPIA